ncbi:MAG: response regulator transcription factor [Oscillospiraceae bacterium]|nr:response regulator transcription factor [Oscillospiraceae bacterium]
MKKILIVEDDIDISNLIVELIKQNHYEFTAAYSGSEALLCFKASNYDLVLLDLMLPGKTGFEVLTELRKSSQIPVIVLTAVTDKESVVKLLTKGADDYIEKPFDNDELMARIQVQFRKNTIVESSTVFRDIILDETIYDAVLDGKRVELSKTEYSILKLLMSAPKRVFTKNNIYESVWGGEFLGDDNTVNVHISKIRTKLSRIKPNTEYIQTVWGIGFKMKD